MEEENEDEEEDEERVGQPAHVEGPLDGHANFLSLQRSLSLSVDKGDEGGHDETDLLIEDVQEVA
mgnify:CR=1 FL=1